MVFSTLLMASGLGKGGKNNDIMCNFLDVLKIEFKVM